MVLQWVGFVCGIAVLAGTAASVVGALVVPRGIDSGISRACEHGVDMGFALITQRVRSYERRDRILAWQAPATLLLRLGVWMGLLVFGYGLVLVPLVPAGLLHPFSEAGSSVFTLGYSPPGGTPSTIVDYVGAFTGLVVVGLQIGYLPTLYAAFNRRETEVTLLVSRAGVPAWGPEILARTQWGIYDGDTRLVLNDLFDRWERWSAEVAESHTTYLTLVRLRSPRPLSHWLTSIVAVMDAAALHLALAPDEEPKVAARRCLRMGFTALRQIAATMRLPVDEDPDPDEPISVAYEEFAVAVETLRSLNYPVQVSTADAWPHFRGWRVNYESVAYALAYAVDAPPALWSGNRRWPSEPISPKRPPARLASDARPRATRTRAAANSR
jgi:hypothetical protein